jgi:N-acetylglucosamine kinase-like BadF-type ATPase
MTRCYLGVDIGGSKSHAILVSETGQILGFGKTGPGNHEQVGFDGLANVLALITDEALAQAGLSRSNIAGAGFGMCGYDWESEKPPHLAAIATLGLNAPVEIVNDAMIGLIAGASDGWGVCAVAGTSCNAWGRDAHRRYGHAIGMGQMFGEAGGSSELTYRARWAIGYAYTKRGAPTRLTDAFMEHFGASSEEALIEGCSEGHYQFKPHHAPIVFRVANEGDEVAQSLVRWAGTELGLMSISVIRQLELQKQAFEVVMAGSFYRGSPMIAESLAAQVLSEALGARFVRLEAHPVVGGALLGMEMAGCSPETISAARQALIAQPVVD